VLKKLLLARDYYAVAAWLVLEYFPRLDWSSAFKMARTCPIVGGIEMGWSEGTYKMWIKSRVIELKVLVEGKHSPAPVRFFTELHTGFMYLVETPEELEMLRRPDVVTEPKAARSKIEDTNLKQIKPINRTAARVAPTDQNR
jgi:hypothetical protein